MFLTPNSNTLLTFLTPKKERYFIRVEIHQQQWNHEELHCRRPCLRSLLTFSAFKMSAYSRWALIRSWALIWVNTVPSHLLVSDGFCNVSITGLWPKCYEVNQELMHTGTQCPLIVPGQVPTKYQVSTLFSGRDTLPNYSGHCLMWIGTQQKSCVHISNLWVSCFGMVPAGEHQVWIHHKLLSRWQKCFTFTIAF